ncbi:hypothetical protein, conserved [Eimeria maxima]|uniref:Uncharacterized protein n=1 Tax=Eimeria maxima TaxID=5804 RepID=U6M661_EIMMA|nr:hypothetical protein, conserved [Eimeria maxima]CDJ58528.1 hypothetical protein, conserved [Eimeria maxima]
MDAQGSSGLSVIGDSSVLLEVAGEFTVPSVSSKEELQEILMSNKYVLDMRQTEIRMSDSLRREVYEALGVEEIDGTDLLKKSILLSGSITNAPSGTNELVRCFLRRGSREQHFSLLRELARRRRADLERDATKKGAPRQQRVGGGKIAKESVDRQLQSAATVNTPGVIHVRQGYTPVAAASGTVGKKESKEELKTIGPTQGTAVAVRSNGLPQPHDELTTFRSATTASELGTFR